LTIEPPYEIIKAWIIDKKPQSVDIGIVKLLPNAIPNTIEFSNSLLNPGDLVSFVITIVDDPKLVSNPKFQCFARIAGVREILVKKYNEELDVSMYSMLTRGFYRVDLLDVFGVAIMTASAFFLSLYVYRRNNSISWSSSSVELKIVFMALITGMSVTYIYVLIDFILTNPSPREWAFWTPGIVVGILPVIFYVFFVFRNFRNRNYSRGKDEK
jgi:hypothetical protein